jgi:D-alanyl-D-alanine carboxypeptidase/D-alanyl-D-alanine-endopeptidase (penicillin-binding protein 4)
MRKRAGLLPLLIAYLPVTGICSSTLPPGVQKSLNLRKAPDSTLSVYIENLDTGEQVLTWNEDVPRNPASVVKLLTTLVALDVLGPAYTWRTEVFSLGEIRDDVLDGDLLIKGYGDPWLVTERVWQMLRQIRQQGIRQITGDLLLDDSYFDVPYHDPAKFDQEPLRAYNVAPNALLMNFKVVQYYFEPEPESGRVSIRIDPPLQNLQIVNRLKIVKGRCRGYQRGITITPNHAVDRMIMSGKFPSGCRSYVMGRTALSHNQFAYGLFKSIWLESGGEFSGSYWNVIKPDNAEPLLVFKSWPLTDVITKVNKHSNNVMARQLLFTLAAEKYAVPGTEEGGRRVVEDWLKEKKLYFEELKLENGSGLSRESRLSAEAIGRILRYAWQSPFMPEFLSSLSLSGLDGTLARRFRNDPLTGKAHIKTGRLDDVAAIAGYLQSRSGNRYAVVALQNHTNVHRGPGEEVQAALLRWLYEQ